MILSRPAHRGFTLRPEQVEGFAHIYGAINSPSWSLCIQLVRVRNIYVVQETQLPMEVHAVLAQSQPMP